LLDYRFFIQNRGKVELYERFHLASAPRNFSIAHMLAQNTRQWNKDPEFWQGPDEVTKPFELGLNSGQ